MEDLGPVPSPMIPYLTPPPTPSQQMGGAEADRNAPLHGGPRRPRHGAHQNHGTQRTPSTATSAEEEDYYSDAPASEDLISIGQAPWLPPEAPFYSGSGSLTRSSMNASSHHTGASDYTPVSESMRSELLLPSPAFQPTPASLPPMEAPAVEERQFPIHPHPSQSTASESKASSLIYSGHYSSDGNVPEDAAMSNTRSRNSYRTPTTQEDLRVSPYGVVEERPARHRASPYLPYSQLSRREILRRMDVIEEEKESLARRDIQRRRRPAIIHEVKEGEPSNALPFFDRWEYHADTESEDDGSRVVWGPAPPSGGETEDEDGNSRSHHRYRDMLGRGGGLNPFSRRS